MAVLLGIAAVPLLLGVPSGAPTSLTFRFTNQSAPHVETVVGWMAQNVLAKVVEAAWGPESGAEDAADYFASAQRAARLRAMMWEPKGPARTTSAVMDTSFSVSELKVLRPRAEMAIQRQISDALVESGVGFRLADTDVLFPPVLFRFESPPHLLVVSPRDRIERLSTVLLRPGLSVDEAEMVEKTVSSDLFSALVTPIGGLGVYPSMVPEGSDIRWTLRTVAHEWAHQFLALRPAGWRYAFGAEKDGRMVTINETAAEIVGREIGDKVYRRYYADADVEIERSATPSGPLRRYLRDVRAEVERLLARGEVDEAENFMEFSRQELVGMGYPIRKLNQAYFAFHGSYADEPSLAGPEGEDINGRLYRLRERSASLGDFAWTVSGVGSYQDFRQLTVLD